MARPALFVGSSSEGLRIAEAIQVVLDPVCEVELWTPGILGLMQGTLESLRSWPCPGSISLCSCSPPTT